MEMLWQVGVFVAVLGVLVAMSGLLRLGERKDGDKLERLDAQRPRLRRFGVACILLGLIAIWMYFQFTVETSRQATLATVALLVGAILCIGGMMKRPLRSNNNWSVPRGLYGRLISDEEKK